MKYFSLMAAWMLAIWLNGHQVNATLIERDWKTPGDGLLTYDTVNQREWLDLSQTILSEQFPGDELADKYLFILSQTASGGYFEGFLVADRADVLQLTQTAGIDTSTQNHTVNLAPTNSLIQLLGTTVPPADSNQISIGLINEFENENDLIPLSAVLWTLPNQAGLIFGTAHAQFGSSPGVMLYRVIPEPSTVLLSVFSLYCLVIYISKNRGHPAWPHVRFSPNSLKLKRHGGPHLGRRRSERRRRD